MATQCCISDGDRLQLVISDKVMVSMDTLPEELLLRIFSHLPYSSLLSAGQTSKRWFRCSKDPSLLRDLLQLIISDKVMLSMDTLPEELLLRIFSHLPYSSLLSAGQTSKRWFRCSKDPLLLRAVASRDFSRDHSAYSDQEIWAAVFLG